VRSTLIVAAAPPGARGGVSIPLHVLGKARTAERVFNGPGKGVVQISRSWESTLVVELVTLNVIAPRGTVSSTAGWSETIFGWLEVESLKRYSLGSPAVTVTTVAVGVGVGAPGSVVTRQPRHGVPETTAVSRLYAIADPAEFSAVTFTRSLPPASTELSFNVALMAPRMSLHGEVDATPQTCHCKEKLSGGVPNEAPYVALSVDPTCGLPEIEGAFRMGGDPPAVSST
jgi:hypothetical protein